MVLWFVLATAMADQSWSAGETPVVLEPCPRSPNCVSSLAADSGHRVEPFVLEGNPEQGLDRIARVLGAMPRTRIVIRQSNYMKVEFRTRLGFVDDVDFAVDKVRGVIDVRSASRIGYWDLGLNRKRVEILRNAFTAKSNP